MRADFNSLLVVSVMIIWQQIHASYVSSITLYAFRHVIISKIFVDDNFVFNDRFELRKKKQGKGKIIEQISDNSHGTSFLSFVFWHNKLRG